MIKEQILSTIGTVLEKKGIDSSKLSLTPPSNRGFGDYSTSIALSLAKNLKKNPMILAEEIANDIETNEMIGNVEVVKPGFINLWINTNYLTQNIQNILTNEDYGHTNINTGKKVIVEYSSPNIAKPFTIGHLRSTIIGDAIANILAATGFTVFRDNHVGDWGTQFGKLIYAIKTWGNIEDIEQAERPVKALVKLYIKFHDEAEKDPTLEDEGRKWFTLLEEGNQEARELWKRCIEWSWKEFDNIYRRLGVSFSEHDGRGYGESYFEDKMKPIIEELEETLSEKGLYKESKGAHLVFFPDEKYPPLMILKQDGSTLYSTRDLATDKFRLTNPRYGSDVMIINEVGIEQSLYFSQLYETEKMLGWVKDGQRVHIKHGLYRFKDMKMSTRKGNVIWLEDVLEEAKQRAETLGKEQSITTVETAETIGIGALKWNDLKRSSHLDIIFDWDEILNMDGNSGPYIQYTYVRCQSVLTKASADEITIENSAHFNEEESQLMRLLALFPEIVADAARNYSPNTICTYLFELAQLYNLFYQKHPILKAEDTGKKLRLAITAATARVLQNGLQLLGIQTVERM